MHRIYENKHTDKKRRIYNIIKIVESTKAQYFEIINRRIYIAGNSRAKPVESTRQGITEKIAVESTNQSTAEKQRRIYTIDTSNRKTAENYTICTK